MVDLNVKIGHKVETQDGREGTVRYIGPLHVAPGEWLGLELADHAGKNDGSVQGQRYFQCAPGFGIFVRRESAVKILNPTAPVPKANGAPTSNGAATKPRPSSGMTADVARKRQSLMSTGSATVAGSRLSLRVWNPVAASWVMSHANFVLPSLPRSRRQNQRNLLQIRQPQLLEPGHLLRLRGRRTRARNPDSAQLESHRWHRLLRPLERARH